MPISVSLCVPAGLVRIRPNIFNQIEGDGFQVIT